MSSPPHHDVYAMSPMTPRWHSCHLCHRHGINDTIMATMTPRCPGAGKGRFCCKTMAQYGTVCNICPPHLTMTYYAMSPMTPRWHSCHLCHRHWINDTVLELGKGYFGVKQWHNMAQYVIYVLPTSQWRICYVTHDTTMALMSPMSQTWNQWHYHGNNDTTLFWSWERAILL